MKKTYISPMTQLHTIALQSQLLAGSAKGNSVFDDEADPTLGTLSRRGCSIWDDEEEEDVDF